MYIGEADTVPFCMRFCSSIFPGLSVYLPAFTARKSSVNELLQLCE